MAKKKGGDKTPTKELRTKKPSKSKSPKKVKTKKPKTSVVGPLITTEVLKGSVTKFLPRHLSRAMNTIKREALAAIDNPDAPPALAQIGREIVTLGPVDPEYAKVWDPPLGVYQLGRFFADQASIEWVRSRKVRPADYGPNLEGELRLVVIHMMTAQPNN